ncbi:hypothetical protein JD969_05670 [Planctomycetota bacterium]|nr:hypothetical protein JD969_05670 [Planctomycetota bacterium]
MNRIQLACCALIASAFVLSGLLVLQLDKKFEFENKANADMVNHQGNVTYLTARIRDNEDALFVLDGSQEKLAIFRTDTNRDTIELVQTQDVASLFDKTEGNDTDSKPKTRGRRSR